MSARRLARALRRVALLAPLALVAAAFVILSGSTDSRGLRVGPFARPLIPTSPAKFVSAFDRVNPEDLQSLQNSWSLDKSEETTSAQTRRPWFMKDGDRRPEYSPHTPPLFPEDDPGNDRIVEQLMYTLPEDEAPLKTILLANGVSAWNEQEGRGVFLSNQCPVDRCTLTGDRRLAATADAVIHKDRVADMLRGPRLAKSMNQIWMLYYLECPYHTGLLSDSQLDAFNWTATYRRDSDIVTPYEKWVYHDPGVTDNKLERNYAANKTKKVAWFVSNCHARNKRLQYANELAKHIQVDIYGACGPRHCPRTDPACLDMLDKEYKFYLAFENSNCRDYITEKFFVNGLGRDVLPIVMGAHPSEYAAVAPHKSYIHVEEFASPAELAAYLHLLDSDDQLYNSYFKWKGTGEFINTYFFCRVCAMLHAAERQARSKHYANVREWWGKDACTSREWRASSGGGGEYMAGDASDE